MINIAETAVPYAILALYDADVEITEENLAKILKAAGIEVEPVWLSVFCRSIDCNTIKAMLNSFEAGAGGSAPVAAAAPGAPAASGAPKAGAAPAAPAKKEEPEEEEELSLSLFD
jgi:large subunit ribosomal protein LP1